MARGLIVTRWLYPILSVVCEGDWVLEKGERSQAPPVLKKCGVQGGSVGSTPLLLRVCGTRWSRRKPHVFPVFYQGLLFTWPSRGADWNQGAFSSLGIQCNCSSGLRRTWKTWPVLTAGSFWKLVGLDPTSDGCLPCDESIRAGETWDRLTAWPIAAEPGHVQVSPHW